MQTITTNEGGILLNGGKEGMRKGKISASVDRNGQVRATDGNLTWFLNPLQTTVDGDSFGDGNELVERLLSFNDGGSTGAGVQSVGGNLVDNTDPNNPKVNLTDGMITGVNIRSSEAIVFDKTGYYTYEGDEDIVSILPDVAASEGKRFILFNAEGDGTWTVEGDIYESGADVTSLMMMRGENYIIYSNGNKWMIV